MSFWEKIQKDIRKNITEGIAIVKEGSAVVSQRIERLTEEGKRKYKIFSLNMKVQDEFARLGGKIYDLSHKSKNPMSNKRVAAIIAKIKKLETQVAELEKKHRKRVVKSGRKKARRRTAKTSFKKKTV